MPCVAQEAGLHRRMVPSGPESWECRNRPNSLHMASHYRGGEQRDLALRRKEGKNNYRVSQPTSCWAADSWVVYPDVKNYGKDLRYSMLKPLPLASLP